MNLAALNIKRKDLIYIVITAIVIIVAIIVGYGELNQGKTSTNANATVEVVKPIGAKLNTAALDHLRDEKASTNFVLPMDLNTGVGNPTPFKQ